MNVKVKYSRSAANTPAFALIAEGWCHVVIEGHTPDYLGVCPVTQDTELLYAVSDDGDAVGILAFSQDAKTAVITIKLAYVEPSSRHQHVFTELFTSLKALAKGRGVNLIYADVSAGNEIARKAMLSADAELISVNYEVVVS